MSLKMFLFFNLIILSLVKFNNKLLSQKNMNRTGLIALRLGLEIERFNHRDIDGSLTHIIMKRMDRNDSYSLEIRLFDEHKNPIVKDQDYLPYYFIPGIRFIISEMGKSATIDRAYIRPEYAGKGIGTALVAKFEAAARSAGVKKICLRADHETNAKDYWRLKHNFRSVDPSDQFYMEKYI
jgi:GNAT superfamily N-acetyltransferase